MLYLCGKSKVQLYKVLVLSYVFLYVYARPLSLDVKIKSEPDVILCTYALPLCLDLRINPSTLRSLYAINNTYNQEQGSPY